MTGVTRPGTATELERFRACVMADEALALSLSEIADAAQFVGATTACATARGIALDAAIIRQAIQPDPLNIARHVPQKPNGSNWPPRHWLPFHVSTFGHPAVVTWAHAGTGALTKPFFEDSVRRIAARPFNRLFRYGITLDDFLRGFSAKAEDSLAPNGFIFHMSRCGSTLVAQMLAACARNIVISEAAPIDAIVQICRMSPHMPAQRQVDLLRAMITAYGRPRHDAETDYVIKLDSWHALALPLFRRAFPSVPWLFLYRDPVEVLVSQVRQRGAQMVPDLTPPQLYGIDGYLGVPDNDYCARVLGKICAAAADSLEDGDGLGLAVGYRDLPAALWSRILPHFGMSCDDRERSAMSLAASRDAKSPHSQFVPDSVGKQNEATPILRGLADRHIGEAIRRLDGANCGGIGAKAAGSANR